MVLRLEEIGQICRFCLGRGNLMALSEATSSAFAIEDAMHHTGVELSEKEGVPYAICEECCQAITRSINFRRACSRNDIIFKKLVAVLTVRMKGNTATQEPGEDGEANVFHGDRQHSTGETRTKTEARSDSPTKILEDNDCDDWMPPTNFLQTNENTGTGNDSDTNDSEPSLYSEVLQETSNGNFVIQLSVPSRRRFIEDSEEMHLMSVVLEEEEKETATRTKESNPISRDDSDSNDSLPSLYGEAMAEAAKNKKQKGKTANSGDPNVEVNPRDKLKMCHLCGAMNTSFKDHMQKRHMKVKHFTCSHCSKAFLTNGDLNRHINTWHERRIILTCVQCGRGFTNHNSHYYHMANSHGKSDVYECETCHKKLKSWDGYKKHLKEHSLTCFPCPDCDKLFKTSGTLEKHQLRYHPT